MESISDSQLYKFAELMRHINSEYGTPVLLRFMHEMNGNWLPYYGQKPHQFKQAFVTMASYVHQLTNMTAMLWSPNIGGGYPYGGGDSLPKANDPDPIQRENFQQLNTNNAGSSANRIDALDDPYGPYYPGDEYVDWVGLSVYNLNYDPNSRQTTAVPPSVFTDPSSGVYFGGGNVDSIRNFYKRFAQDKRKPFILSETGSSFVSNAPGSHSISEDRQWNSVELNSKQSW